MFRELPIQTAAGVGAIDIVGSALMVTVFVAVLVQPFGAIAVTV